MCLWTITVPEGRQVIFRGLLYWTKHFFLTDVFDWLSWTLTLNLQASILETTKHLATMTTLWWVSLSILQYDISHWDWCFLFVCLTCHMSMLASVADVSLMIPVESKDKWSDPYTLCQPMTCMTPYLENISGWIVYHPKGIPIQIGPIIESWCRLVRFPH